LVLLDLGTKPRAMPKVKSAKVKSTTARHGEFAAPGPRRAPTNFRKIMATRAPNPEVRKHPRGTGRSRPERPIVTISLLPQEVDAPRGQFDNALCVE
jgi:hypothetical protein